MHKRKSASHAKTQPLFLQMSLLLVEFAYSRSILSMFRAVLCYAQPLNTGICTAYEYFFRLPLSVTLIRILPVNKRLRNLGRIQFIAKSSSIYTKNCLRHRHQTFWRSWRKVSATTFIAKTQAHFTKTEIKKVIAKMSSKNLTAGV